ncbi:uncharacterized protein KY384_005560 [Bacidia gigantensis]|uniref:uncharacterized protein n=1 Tax=Bacidia gigantensis TaxID=2732470 RepID=UPI001D054314|nr:uncharacterized protein KY384_005560 [Bacidia gigantensis]KAG8530078.1 hypothetical protein KY384_005560 [Bacidia gigantensis]
MNGLEAVEILSTDPEVDDMLMTEDAADDEATDTTSEGKMLDMDGMEDIDIDIYNSSSSDEDMADADDTDDEEEDIYGNNRLIDLDEPTGPQPTILQLPTEVFQIIQRHMDIGTFFISLLTCKSFLNAAFSKPLLSYHLRQLPGLGLGLEHLDEKDLLHIVRTRAGQSGHAAGVLANVTSYDADLGCMTAKAAFTWHDPARPCSKHSYLAIPNMSGIIQIYELSKHPVRRREELQIHHEDCNPGRISILKVAFAAGSKDLAVLCTQETCLDEHHSAFAKRLHEGAASCSLQYKLVVFHRCYAKQKGHFFSSAIQETRDIEFPRGASPVGLALAQNGTACILWHGKHPKGKKKEMVWIIHRHDKLMEVNSHDPEPQMTPIHRLAADIPDRAPPVVVAFNAQFSLNGESLLLFKPGHHIHSWYASTPQADGRGATSMQSNSTLIDVDKYNGRHLWEINIGKPFYERHMSDVFDEDDDTPQCRRSWLALGFADRRAARGFETPSVFIMQSDAQKPTADCDHLINLDGNTTWWKPIALLGGYKHGTSTLGTIMAVSPDGTRVAAALWNRIYLWTLDPKMLVEGDLHLYFPPRDYNPRKGIGRLRPTLLSTSSSVVHGMQWTNEENLFAVTDRGLMKWDLGCMSDGTRESFSMPWDIWSSNALNVPAPGSGEPRVPATMQDIEDDEDE